MKSPLTLRVRHSGVIDLQFFRDPPDGNLAIVEARRQVAFDIRRVYFINALANPRAVRGRHAHHQLEQAIFCINGSFELSLDDGERRQKLKLSDPTRGIRLGPMLWHTMSKFSPDCVILVLASDWFDAGDYIRDYDAFLRLVRPARRRPAAKRKARRTSS
jgi:hypothetical protein